MARLNLAAARAAHGLRAGAGDLAAPGAKAVRRARAGAGARARASRSNTASCSSRRAPGRCTRASNACPPGAAHARARREALQIVPRAAPAEERRSELRDQSGARAQAAGVAIAAARARLFCGFAVLAGRAVYLQGCTTTSCRRRASRATAACIEISANRGRITDRHGEVLAVSTPVKSIWAIPEDVKLEPPQLARLAAAARDAAAGDRASASTTRDAISSSSSARFRRRSPIAIAELRIPGRVPEPRIPPLLSRRRGDGARARVHRRRGRRPGGHRARLPASSSPGKPGSRRVIRTGWGRSSRTSRASARRRKARTLVARAGRQDPEPRVRAAQGAVEQHRAKAGGIVVLDVDDGRGARAGESAHLQPEQPLAAVRRAAPQPRRHRHLRARLDAQALHHRARARVGPRDAADDDPDRAGQRSPSGRRPSATRMPRALLTVEQVIQKSSNVGAAKIALVAAGRVDVEHVPSVGLRRCAAARLPGRGDRHACVPTRPGGRSSRRRWPTGTASRCASLQLAHAYTVFARDGELVPLSLVRVDAPARRQAAHLAEDRAAVRHMLELAVAAGRHRAAGADHGLPRRRQDRHRAQAGERRLRAGQVSSLRRLRAGVAARAS